MTEALLEAPERPPPSSLPVGAARPALRTGEDTGGVVGMRPAGLPDEHGPGLPVRFTGIDDRAVASDLVSAHSTVAALEDVQVGPAWEDR
ncbi:hypothetical protein [Pseudonocardia lacus]|uniref:hypothetical protein n=1 Tax=Pseudonocardia lacus TaxID=2835865 RepID=UPI001BDBCAC5|nr:hypothetical protein [Pseudonocardia lacus]